MRIKDQYDAHDVSLAREVVRAHPFATIVTADQQATHMPCLLDDEAGDDLTILGHVARADPAAGGLDGPLLLIFHGPHGYISASWYAADTISTWNNVTLHVRGTPEVIEAPLPLLRRTVDHFEAADERPWSLDRMEETATRLAGRVRGFRLRASWWHLEAKLSQDKPAGEQARILAGLERPGPYENRALAAAMRDERLRPRSAR